MTVARSKKGSWSAQELHRLKELFPRCSQDRVAQLLGRSVRSVRRRAIELFERAARRGSWSDEEEEQLRVSYGILELADISLVLARAERECQIIILTRFPDRYSHVGNAHIVRMG